jgi:two-component system nitrogen regulation response regulator NtrX
MISGHGTIATAVEATKKGAFDFLEKPLEEARVLTSIRNALQHRRLAEENRSLREERGSRYELIGKSPAIGAVLAAVARAAPTQATILITGESGTGKESVAWQAYRQSARSDRPFVKVNCAAIPEELIETELFGHTRGAFTGALTTKKGKFEAADGGTLFLDEVGDMTLKTQAKVLRVLQEQRIEPVGGAASITIDVRVIAATNKRLEEEIRKGTFREDLYFRLNVIPFEVAPLRERRDDLPLLARHFIVQFSEEYGKRPKELTPEALELLTTQLWPGNVRELRNIIERLVIMTPGDRIEARHLPAPLLGSLIPNDGGSPASAGTLADFPSLLAAREDFEKRYIWKKYQECAGNMSRTAEALQVERSNLYRKMKGYGLLPIRSGEPLKQPQ